MVAAQPDSSPTVAAAPGAATVSVLVPTYNRAGLVRACLESIAAQTHPVHELIVIDDGSTDDTAGVMRELQSAPAFARTRLRYLRQANQGKSVALNRGLALATGEWVAFNDSDDLWVPDKLEWQFRALQAFPRCRACFSNASYSHHYSGRNSEFEGGLEVAGEMGELPDHLRVALTNRRIRMQTVVVRADTLRAAGAFDPALRVAQDIDFIYRLALVTPLCYVNRPLVEINRDPAHQSRLTVQHTLASLVRDQAHEIMLAKWQALSARAPADVRDAIRRDLRIKRSAIANHLLLAGDIPGARAVLTRGLRERADWRLLLKFALTAVAPGLYQRGLRTARPELQPAH